MATVPADRSLGVSSSVSASHDLAHLDERRPQVGPRARGWQQRLAPLAQHMAERRLVCARGYAGAPLHRLDLEVLRDALGNLLRDPEAWEDGYLIYHIVVEGAEPATTAAGRGVSEAALVDELRDAVDRLATEY